jgi:pimeloyl-ACP methyl ester carboxylesterase
MADISNAAVSQERRKFLGMAALTGVTSQFVSAAPSAAATFDQPTAPAPWGALEHVDAGDLRVSYADAGPRGAPAVILLHGWPYSIDCFAEAAARLIQAGHRVIVPELRGHGGTRFLSAATIRNGEQSALAFDVIALMDALGVQSAVLGGCDWGARTACIVAALWPERCKALVSVSGYLIADRNLNEAPLPPRAELQWWYQYYFATRRGELGYAKNRREFARLIWELASPKWRFDDEVFARSATVLDNPDHVAVVIHNYRWRLGLAKGEARYAEAERRLAQASIITVPTVTLEGDANGAPHPNPAAYRGKFTGRYVDRLVSGGVGHNLPQEAPAAFTDAIVEAGKG